MAFITNLEQLKAVSMLPSGKSKSAKFIYENKLRSVVFKLEALTRICRSVYEKKLFKSFKEDFKMLEDSLGAMEYYDDFYKEFSGDRLLYKNFINYFSAKREEERKKLDASIKEQKLLTTEFFEKAFAIIEKNKWQNSDQERASVIKFLSEQIDSITSDLNSGELNFGDIESGLHETRRKIRWISIYVAVVNGVVQLKKTITTNPALTRYLTPEIINLPYNKMPKQQRGIPPVYIQSQNFYALSWIINELGKLKDEGLKRVIVEKVLDKTQPAGKKEIRNYLLKSVRTTETICNVAENLVDEFVFTNRVLDRINRDLKSKLGVLKK